MDRTLPETFFAEVSLVGGNGPEYQIQTSIINELMEFLIKEINQTHGDIRTDLCKPGDQLQQKFVVKRNLCSDPELAFTTFTRPTRLLRRQFKIFQNASRLLKKFMASDRLSDAAASPFKKRNPYIILKRTDPSTDGRLTHAKGIRRAIETATLCNGKRVGDRRKVENYHLILSVFLFAYTSGVAASQATFKKNSSHF